MSVMVRNNIRLRGPEDGQPMMFAHGFGCDQNMWRFVTPAFEDRYRIVLFDQVGYGGSDLAAWSPKRYESLQGYADDIVEIVDELGLENVILVGHSVSAMIGALATISAPQRFATLIMVGPSPRYVEDEGYVGNFTEADIEGLLDSLESNYLGWSAQMAPVIMGNRDRPELGAELTESFCRTDPEIARHFARVTFLSDNRADLPRVPVPTLVLQCSEDVIAPQEVGAYVHRHLPDSELVLMRATGHCPNLSAPDETIEAIARFLGER